MQRDAAIGTVKGGKLIEAAAVSRTGFGSGALLEKAFALAFRGLVYPQIWEDPVCDMAGLEIGPDDHVVAIASGGCNALSYLTADPARVTALDLNSAHAALNRLKRAATLHLPDYAHFRRFLAEADRTENVAAYYRYLAPHLDAGTRAYWEARDAVGRRRIGLFAKNLYRHGLLGGFIGFIHLLARLHGIRPAKLLEARSLTEQRAHFERYFLPFFTSPLIRWMTDQRAALFGFGIPPAQYEKLAGGRSMIHVLRERLEKLACDFDLSDNYFAWQAFARAYDRSPEASLPPYLQQANFDLLRERIGRLDVVQANLTDWLARQQAHSVDKFVLLDAQDWMTDSQLNALWGQICRTARPGARVLFRTAGEPDLLPGRLAPAMLDMWDYRAEQSRALLARDRSSIYGGVHLYVRRD